MGSESDITCKLERSLVGSAIFAAQNQLAFFSLDRYLAVRNFGYYYDQIMFKLRVPLLATFINYSLALVLNTPDLLYSRYNEELDTCRFDGTKTPEFYQSIVSLFFLIFYAIVPLLVTLFCNIATVKKLRYA